MKGWRTVAFNALMTVVAVLAYSHAGDPSELPDANAINAALDAVEGFIPFVWGLGNVILRAVTDTPIFKSGAAE